MWWTKPTFCKCQFYTIQPSLLKVKLTMISCKGVLFHRKRDSTSRPYSQEHELTRPMGVSRVSQVNHNSIHYQTHSDVHDREPGADRTFPYQIINSTSMTVESCLTQCSDFGYPAGGLEFGDECCTWDFFLGLLIYVNGYCLFSFVKGAEMSRM